jgi:uncharacterized protein DUF1344
MRKALIGAVVFAFALSGVAWGADIEGKVKSVDPSEKSFTLDDGTKIWVGDSVSLDSLKEGADVKASFEEKDGKNIATSVEVK